jgi:hypothetical protein
MGKYLEGGQGSQPRSSSSSSSNMSSIITVKATKEWQTVLGRRAMAGI